MQFQSQNDQQKRHRLIFVLATCGTSLLGGSTGLLLGRQADLLFNIDAGIVGLVVGALVGSLLPLMRSVHLAIRLAAAGVGVAVPILGVVGSARVAPEVFWGMIVLAMACSAMINTLIGLISHADQASQSRWSQ
jgi:peptidoglycan/LPS O-acetylase OafA/YrhL